MDAFLQKFSAEHIVMRLKEKYNASPFDIEGDAARSGASDPAECQPAASASPARQPSLGGATLTSNKEEAMQKFLDPTKTSEKWWQ